MEVKKLKNYINGLWVESRTNQWLEVGNPAKDELISLFIPSMIGGKHQGKFVN
jgi:hypothetical protein